MLLVPFLLIASADAEATYKLGGPRQVVAVVTAAGADHVVRVRMLAVAAFDDATNEKLNRLKAEHFALQALARHLSKDRKATLELSGGRVTAAAKDGKAYTLTFRVPEKNVVLVRAGDGPKPGRTRFAFDTPFFTRKRDLIETARLLTQSLQADLADAEKKVTKDRKTAEAFLLRQAELEERGEGHFKKLRAEINTDKFLLTVERDEALEQSKSHESAWERALAAIAKKYADDREGDGR